MFTCSEKVFSLILLGAVEQEKLMKCNGNHDHYKGKCLEIDWVGTAAGAERYPKPQVSNKDYTEEIKQINAANRLRVKERLLKENVKPW